MTMFVLFSQQRCGVGALASFVTTHSGFSNLTEVLNPYDVSVEGNFFNYWLNNDPTAMVRKVRSPSDLFVEYLDDLDHTHGGSNIMIEVKLNSIRNVLNYWEELPGFTHAGMPWLLHILQGRGYPIVYLHRENHLHRFVSSQLADLTGVYRTHDPAAVGHGTIEVDIDQMRDFICKSEWSHEAFMRYFGQFDRSLLLTYKSTFVGNALTADAKINLARFFGFQLRLDAEPYYVRLRRASLDKVIVNYQEVCAELTRLERGHYIEP